MELEPSIRHVARSCAVSNANVLDNPKVHLTFGDARETLLTTRATYDVVFSEPSNPYRAGVASLFTQEFYAAVRHRLGPQGVFLQFIQAYEVDNTSILSFLATLASVFPHVEVWMSDWGDLLARASVEPPTYDVPRLRARLREEPYRSGQ